MKEASGELNMTLVTIIAIVGVAAIFTTVILPMIEGSIKDKWGEKTDNLAGAAEVMRIM